MTIGSQRIPALRRVVRSPMLESACRDIWRIAHRIVSRTAGSGTDPGDADTGTNNQQNFPVLASAILVSGEIVIAYLVDSDPANLACPLAVDS
jgi:hypothetical protein